MSVAPRHPRDDSSEYWAFIRANHPDVGGDPEVFMAGLRQWQAARGGRGAPEPSRPGDRFDGPISFFRTRPGVSGEVERFTRWWERRRHGPRVE
jgi:hypothetical protein